MFIRELWCYTGGSFLYDRMSLPALMEEFQKRLAMRREQKKIPELSAETVIMQMNNAKRNPRSTTIVGVEWKDGIVMAGDRLTSSWGDYAFSRTSIKLDNIQNNAVIGTCGMAAFAQLIKEDLDFMCGLISARIKRPVSLEGKCNLLRQVVLANLAEIPWCYHVWVPFGAILGGVDKFSGKFIVYFDDDGGVYKQRDFLTAGSGGAMAQAYLDDRFQHDLDFEGAVARAIGAIRQAGKYVTSVSHPADPAPTVKIISSSGINTLPESLVERYMVKLEEEDRVYRNKVRKGGRRR